MGPWNNFFAFRAPKELPQTLCFIRFARSWRLGAPRAHKAPKWTTNSKSKLNFQKSKNHENSSKNNVYIAAPNQNSLNFSNSLQKNQYGAAIFLPDYHFFATRFYIKFSARNHMKQSLFLTLRSLVSHGGQFRSRPAGPGCAPGRGRPGSLCKGCLLQELIFLYLVYFDSARAWPG